MQTILGGIAVFCRPKVLICKTMSALPVTARILINSTHPHQGHMIQRLKETDRVEAGVIKRILHPNNDIHDGQSCNLDLRSGRDGGS